MEKELGGTASGQARPCASSPTTNIAYSLANKNANCGKTCGKSAVREGNNPEFVQLSLDLRSVTRTSVVESSAPVVEFPERETLQTHQQHPPTLQQQTETLQQQTETLQQPPLPGYLPAISDPVVRSLYPNGIPFEQSPPVKMSKNSEGALAPSNGKGWVTWHYKIRDCSGKQHSHSCSADSAIPGEASGPYAIYCWHVPGKANGRKYVGKAGGKKYKRFIEVWNQCDSWPKILSRAFGA